IAKRMLHERYGVRTVLDTPLVSRGNVIGMISFRRLEVRPFTDQQLELLETFADQAVIAIENTRLFQELQERNQELSKALAHQTAVSDVLQAIASSPTDQQAALDLIAERAGTVCD